MQKKIFGFCLPVFFLISFFSSCKEPDIVLMMDEKYFEMMEFTDSVYDRFKKSAKNFDLSVELELVITEQQEIDIISLISEQPYKVVVLSPYLGKKIAPYARLLPDTLFGLLDANGKVDINNVIPFEKNRDDFFESLPVEIFEYQQRGYNVGAVFLLSETRRTQEKVLFISKLNELNSQNYRLIDHPIYKTDSSRSAQEIFLKMNREDVDVLLLFAASLNDAILKEIPQSSEMRVITEGLYKEDQIFQDRVYYSVVYDYQPAIDQFCALARNFLDNGEIKKEEVFLRTRIEMISEEGIIDEVSEEVSEALLLNNEEIEGNFGVGIPVPGN